MDSRVQGNDEMRGQERGSVHLPGEVISSSSLNCVNGYKTG